MDSDHEEYKEKYAYDKRDEDDEGDTTDPNSKELDYPTDDEEEVKKKKKRRKKKVKTQNLVSTSDQEPPAAQGRAAVDTSLSEEGGKKTA